MSVKKVEVINPPIMVIAIGVRRRIIVVYQFIVRLYLRVKLKTTICEKEALE